MSLSVNNNPFQNLARFQNDGFLIVRQLLDSHEVDLLGRIARTDKDLAEYDPATDTATLFFDGAGYGLANDIDAVHVLRNAGFEATRLDDSVADWQARGFAIVTEAAVGGTP